MKEKLRSMPFGLGASSLGNLYQSIDDAAARATVDAAWEAGVRYFDTAPFYGYGLSERRLGDALRERPRGDYLLSTKVGRLLKPGAIAADASFQSPMPFHAEFDYSYDGVMRSFEHSQQRLGIDKIDILLMHDLGRLTHGPRHAEMFKQAMDGGFRALAELRASGAVAAIGLGVSETEICQQSMAHAEFDLFLLAGRHTLLNQQATEFLADCHNLGIAIIGAGVYNSGILATGVAGPALIITTMHPHRPKSSGRWRVWSGFATDMVSRLAQPRSSSPGVILRSRRW